MSIIKRAHMFFSIGVIEPNYVHLRWVIGENAPLGCPWTDPMFMDFLHDLIDQGLGSISGIRACALRNFDLEVMEFETALNNTTAKLPILKLCDYEMWEMRIKQYFQVQDSALWEVIENVPVTAEEKIKKKNDVKVKSCYLWLLLYEKTSTYYLSVSTMMLKQCMLLLKLDLEALKSLVWMNKADIKTMSIDDLYNNFKIVEQEVKKSVGVSTGTQNMAFMTTPSTNSTNDVNTANSACKVSTVSPNVNTASSSDLEQIHEDDLEAMDLKWQLSLLSMRAKRYYQRSGKKIFINANDTAGYDKSKVECFNCHKMRHFAMECRAPRNKDGQFRYQDNSRN
ncbi:ribonuclease H-like domain-containing protein [Tanacetum coccineum]|uniref:Ribonuclease H-like domain-containing protein n=1 Tax=Tanacetum coccineum TaxID=301880 RepID=A0ABQ5G1L8_9ASTR